MVFVVLFAILGTAYLISTRAATSSAPVLGIAGKCLDNYANLQRSNNKIQLYQCNGTAAQKWAVTASNTIVNSNGYCLDVPDSSTTARTYVLLNPCDGSTGELWQVNGGNHTITNPHSGLCLDDQYASASDRNPIWIYACNGTNAQTWIPQGVNLLPPHVSLTANPTSIASGTTATLTWNASNAQACTASGGWSGSRPVSGSLSTATLTTATTYILNCTGDGGTASAQVAIQVTTSPPPGKLLFDDEFTGSAGSVPDASKWVVMGGAKPSRWGEECFVNDRSHNSVNGNGQLVLTATYNPGGVPCQNGSGPYESGGMTTGNASGGFFNFKYGTAIASIKVPCQSGTGIWPAWWADGPNWPAGGEIDFLEVMKGLGPDNAQQSLHGPSSTTRYWNINQPHVASTPWCTAYHTYGAVWSPGKIIFTIDGAVTHVDTPNSVPSGGTWPFDSSAERLLLDLQVGASGGTVDNSTFPQSMDIDYVRVYSE